MLICCAQCPLQPLKTCLDPEAGKEFLLCDYNRDADFYRYPSAKLAILYRYVLPLPAG